jgi:hypothetical protein
MVSRVAVLMLSCSDYEALELSLACHMRYTPDDVPYFILQNCRGTYDAERTFAVAQRYRKLFPNRVTVIDHIPPAAPYFSVTILLESDLFRQFDLICKVDDDAFPIADGWLDGLTECYLSSEKEYGEKLAYVTPLINNNTWGFPQVLAAMGLEKEYFSSQARIHHAGYGGEGEDKFRLLSKDEIAIGQDGTIWGLPYLARWLHTKTTLQPDAFIKAVEKLSDAEVPASRRYSIGCILFRKALWATIGSGKADDEGMMFEYCARNDMHIRSRRSIPFVHLAYFSQREENRDITESARNVYGPRLGHPFPISLRSSRSLEIEARLRWLETRAISASAPVPNSPGHSEKGSRRKFWFGTPTSNK